MYGSIWLSLSGAVPVGPPLAYFLPLGGYLIGSIPTAYLMGKAVLGIDIREHGSGNVGATNAMRVLGRKWGIPCLLLDILKGAVPVLGASWLLDPEWSASHWIVAATALATILGHIFTIFLRFRGGKGVASTLGAFLALHPQAVGIAVVVAVIAIWQTRWVSLGSLIIAVLTPILIAVFAAVWGTLDAPEFHAPFTLALLLAAMIVYTHRTNIRRLIAGTERRLGEQLGVSEAPLKPHERH